MISSFLQNIEISSAAVPQNYSTIPRRVQTDMDWRFYHRKYNAEQALASFAALAREEVDLEEISARLLEVVEETVQPEHASLWLTGCGWPHEGQTRPRYTGRALT
jgi:hypothetical protein